jgi:hypothetical protein
MLNDILVGAITAISIVIALFFLRFWKNTGDRFFLLFGLSFLIEGLNRLQLASVTGWQENSPTYYIIRFAAYMLILIAILDKNHRKVPSKQ